MTTSQTLTLIIGSILGIILSLALVGLEASATPTIIGEGTSNNATQIIGNRFFANGTGIAYFSDGAAFPFNHAITPGYGFYYDDSAIFYAGDIPGVSASKTATTNSNAASSNNNNSTIHDIVIPRGFGASSSNVTIQPNLLKIKVGDTVRWVNEDWNSFSLRSPPYVGGGSNVTLSDISLILDGMNFDEYVQPGKTLSIQFTRPGGFHYEISDVAGTIIVEEGAAATINQTATATTSTTTAADSNTTTTRTLGANATTTNTTDTGNSARTTTTGNTSGDTATSVSIVPGSSSLTNTAFSPNPVEVSVGSTVTWTNDDTQPHTVVSGANAEPSGEFDSSPNFNPLLAPGKTFSHTFTEAGEYPYYCALHPNMVGTVSVG